MLAHNKKNRINLRVRTCKGLWKQIASDERKSYRLLLLRLVKRTVEFCSRACCLFVYLVFFNLNIMCC